jgi:putative peptidoglycan lipid II flippase
MITSLLKHRPLASGAIVLACTQFLASFCGFLRDRAFSYMFPLESDPLGIASLYITAFRPSDFLFQFFVISALSVVLVPFLSSHQVKNDEKEMNELLTSTLVLFGVFFGILALATALSMPWIAPYLTAVQGERLALYQSFAMLALLCNTFFVFGNAFSQYLLVKRKLWYYGTMPILWSLSTTFGILVLTRVVGVYGPLLGTLIGALIYGIVGCIGAWKSGFRFSLMGGIVHRDWKTMGWLLLPRMGALGALQCQLLIFDRFASLQDASVIAVNQFARNVESVIPGFIGIAIALSAFSELSMASAKNDHSSFIRSVKQGLLYNLFLAIPGGIALALLAPVAAWLLGINGAPKTLFVTMLMLYSIAIPFDSINHLLLRSFYSLKNTLIPATSSILSAVCSIVAVFFFFEKMGSVAFPLSFLFGQIVHTSILSTSLWRWKKGKK